MKSTTADVPIVGKVRCRVMAYIDVDKFADAICDFSAIDEHSANAVILLLRRQPIADVVEVKHGQWLDNIEKTSTVAGITKDFAIGYKCSLCGRTEINREPYCNCGAKMDGGNAE